MEAARSRPFARMAESRKFLGNSVVIDSAVIVVVQRPWLRQRMETFGRADRREADSCCCMKATTSDVVLETQVEHCPAVTIATVRNE